MASDVEEVGQDVTDQRRSCLIVNEAGNCRIDREILLNDAPVTPSLSGPALTRRRRRRANESRGRSGKLGNELEFIYLNLTLAGYVHHSCPGPVAAATRSKRQAKRKDLSACCKRRVGRRRRRDSSEPSSCNYCDKWTHTRCYDYPVINRYEQRSTSGSDDVQCPGCCASAFPSNNGRVASTAVGRKEEQRRCSQQMEFRVLHLAARSLSPDIEVVRRIARETGVHFMCLAAETRSGDDELGIRNYVRLRKEGSRNGGDGEGVFTTYVRSDLAHDLRASMTCQELEDLRVDVLLRNKTKPILIIDLYHCNCTKMLQPSKPPRAKTKLEVLYSQPIGILVGGFTMMFFIYIGIPLIVCILCCWSERKISKAYNADIRQAPRPQPQPPPPQVPLTRPPMQRA